MSEEQEKSDLQKATERARLVKKGHEASLMSKANVVGVGVGFVQKGGIRTSTVGLVVMVKQKLPPVQLAPQDMIPSEIEGVPVDVQQVGEIRAQ